MPDAQPSTAKLGDWYADTLSLGRERLILCVSERTLLPVIVPAAGAAADLHSKLARGLRETLESLSAPTGAIEAAVSQFHEVIIAKTASRVVLGSMNDFQFMLRHIRLQLPNASLVDLGLELADTPCSPIGYDCPRDAALAALGGQAVQPRARLRAVPAPPRSPPHPRSLTNAEYEQMVEAATVDAYGEAEQAIGWHCAIAENLKTPFETEVLGVPVRVEKVDLTDDDSIVAVCRRGSHRQVIPILELPMPRPPPEGAEWVNAYRRWRR